VVIALLPQQYFPGITRSDNEWSSREALTNVDAQHLDLYIPVIFDLAW